MQSEEEQIGGSLEASPTEIQLGSKKKWMFLENPALVFDKAFDKFCICMLKSQSGNHTFRSPQGSTQKWM